MLLLYQYKFIPTGTVLITQHDAMDSIYNVGAYVAIQDIHVKTLLPLCAEARGIKKQAINKYFIKWLEENDFIHPVKHAEWDIA